MAGIRRPLELLGNMGTSQLEVLFSFLADQLIGSWHWLWAHPAGG